MGKKFITVGGQRIYLKDGEVPAVEEEADDPKPEGDNLDDKVEEVSEKIYQNVSKKLGLDKIADVSSKVEKLLDDQQKGNSKIMEILKGKDLGAKKDTLTKEEKIIGFYHALVTGDVAVVKALSEGTAAAGGYLFPDEFRAEVVMWLAEQNRMRNLVRVIPMKKDILKAPSLASTVKVYWTAENAAKSTTTAVFGEVTLTARKVAAIMYASDELIEDSTDIDVVNLVVELFGMAIAEEEDRVITAGNGTTEPTGITAAGTIRTVTCAGNLDFDDILDMIYAVPQKYHNGSVILAHRTNIKELRKLKDSNNRYLWQDAIAQGAQPTLDGIPVIENNWLGESYIFFGNLKQLYWMGDRKQMSVKISQDTETAFTHDQTAIRVVERIAGNVVLPDAGCLLQTIP